MIKNYFIIAWRNLIKQRMYSIIKIGIPIEADFETLDVDPPDSETVINKMSLVKRVDLMVESTRGVWAGPDADHLTEFKQRTDEGYDEPVSLTTDVISISSDSTYSRGGRVFVRQRDPLPITILSAIPVGDFGGD